MRECIEGCERLSLLKISFFHSFIHSFFFFSPRQIRSSESGRDGMVLIDSKASLICQTEGPLLLVFLGPFQRGRLGEGDKCVGKKRCDFVDSLRI